MHFFTFFLNFRKRTFQLLISFRILLGELYGKLIVCLGIARFLTEKLIVLDIHRIHQGPGACLVRSEASVMVAGQLLNLILKLVRSLRANCPLILQFLQTLLANFIGVVAFHLWLILIKIMLTLKKL